MPGSFGFRVPISAAVTRKRKLSGHGREKQGNKGGHGKKRAKAVAIEMRYVVSAFDHFGFIELHNFLKNIFIRHSRQYSKVSNYTINYHGFVVL